MSIKIKCLASLTQFSLDSANVICEFQLSIDPLIINESLALLAEGLQLRDPTPVTANKQYHVPKYLKKKYRYTGYVILYFFFLEQNHQNKTALFVLVFIFGVLFFCRFC